MSDSFKITKGEVDTVFAWLTYLEHARIALELEDAGHEVICLTVQKTTEAIFVILKGLPPA